MELISSTVNNQSRFSFDVFDVCGFAVCVGGIGNGVKVGGGTVTVGGGAVLVGAIEANAHPLPRTTKRATTRKLEPLILFMTYSPLAQLRKIAPNGLRYLRWGGDGEAVQPEK